MDCFDELYCLSIHIDYWMNLGEKIKGRIFGEQGFVENEDGFVVGEKGGREI